MSQGKEDASAGLVSNVASNDSSSVASGDQASIYSGDSDSDDTSEDESTPRHQYSGPPSEARIRGVGDSQKELNGWRRWDRVTGVYSPHWYAINTGTYCFTKSKKYHGDITKSRAEVRKPRVLERRKRMEVKRERRREREAARREAKRMEEMNRPRTPETEAARRQRLAPRPSNDKFSAVQAEYMKTEEGARFLWNALSNGTIDDDGCILFTPSNPGPADAPVGCASTSDSGIQTHDGIDNRWVWDKEPDLRWASNFQSPVPMWNSRQYGPPPTSPKLQRDYRGAFAGGRQKTVQDQLYQDSRRNPASKGDHFGPDRSGQFFPSTRPLAPVPTDNFGGLANVGFARSQMGNLSIGKCFGQSHPGAGFWSANPTGGFWSENAGGSAHCDGQGTSGGAGFSGSTHLPGIAENPGNEKARNGEFGSSTSVSREPEKKRNLNRIQYCLLRGFKCDCSNAEVGHDPDRHYHFVVDDFMSGFDKEDAMPFMTIYGAFRAWFFRERPNDDRTLHVFAFNRPEFDRQWALFESEGFKLKECNGCKWVRL